MVMLKSIGAVFAGLLFIFVTHIGTDQVMHAIGVFPPAGQPMFDTGQLLIASLYRGIYSIIGCYIAARLAPRRPMLHALILGGIGVLLSTAGAIALWDRGPAWYPLGLIALSLPYAWLGGTLFERIRIHSASNGGRS
jgi:hypothetical protein